MTSTFIIEFASFHSGRYPFGELASVADSGYGIAETYTSLFEDQAKYNAIMHGLGTIIYREMRSQAY